MEYGDTWSSKTGKGEWLYKGNARSDFERFWNDYWITVSRGDSVFFMLLVAIWCFVLAGLHYLLKSPWLGVLLMIGVLAAIIFLFYSVSTFFSSLKEFICYKKDYNSVYQRWIKINSERRRNYIGG
jgi:hypothetical protein